MVETDVAMVAVKPVSTMATACTARVTPFQTSLYHFFIDLILALWEFPE